MIIVREFEISDVLCEQARLVKTVKVSRPVAKRARDQTVGSCRAANPRYGHQGSLSTGSRVGRTAMAVTPSWMGAAFGSMYSQATISGKRMRHVRE